MAATLQQIDVLFYKIVRAYQKMEPYKDAHDFTNETFGNAIKRMESAIKANIISSDNEAVNKLWAIAKTIKLKLGNWISKDDNYWIEKSSGNLMIKTSIRKAIAELKSVIISLDEMKHVSDACKALLIVININDHMDIKGVASTLVSTKALDIEARKLAYKDFSDCIEFVSRVKLKVNAAIKAFERFQ